DAVWPMAAAIGELVMFAGILIWTTYLGLFAAKLMLRPDDARAERDHPVQLAFLSLIGITAVLVGSALLPYVRPVGSLFFMAGAFFLLGYAVHATAKLWLGERDPALSLPMLHIPAASAAFTVAGNAALFGWEGLGRLVFGLGMLSWFAIEALVLQRLLTGPRLAAEQRPLLGVQLAPPTVGGVAALAVFGPAALPIAAALLGYALFQALVLLRMAPWIAANGFAPTWWAFSFGAAALGTLPLRILAQSPSPLIEGLALLLFVAANLVVGALVILTIRSFVGATPRAAAPELS
ncbi:MAG TPA: hypothetical protein VF606_07410, partial [Geminicoccaceae bacterium]